MAVELGITDQSPCAYKTQVDAWGESTMSRCIVLGVVCSLATVLLPISHALSDSTHELLRPVSSEIEAKLLRQTNFGLRSQLYFAKRYKLVEINFDLLDDANSELTISPFDDLQLRVKALQVKGPSSFEQLREWRGELISPRFDGPAFDPDGNPVDVPPDLVSLWVRVGPHEVPPRLAREIAQERKDESSIGVVPETDELPDPTASTHAFATLPLETVSGSVFVLARLSTIIIQPVEDDPRYHIIYEQDPEKVPQTTETQSADTSRKLMRRAEFERQLEKERAEASSMSSP